MNDPMRQGRFRAWPNAGDFQEHFPPKPTLAQQLQALEAAFGQEASVKDDFMCVTVNGATLRYCDAELIVCPQTGTANWRMQVSDPYRAAWAAPVRVGPMVVTPLRGVELPQHLVPPHLDPRREHVWWGMAKDIGLLYDALHKAEEAVTELAALLAS